MKFQYCILNFAEMPRANEQWTKNKEPLTVGFTLLWQAAPLLFLFALSENVPGRVKFEFHSNHWHWNLPTTTRSSWRSIERKNKMEMHSDFFPSNFSFIYLPTKERLTLLVLCLENKRKEERGNGEGKKGPWIFSFLVNL